MADRTTTTPTKAKQTKAKPGATKDNNNKDEAEAKKDLKALVAGVQSPNAASGLDTKLHSEISKLFNRKECPPFTNSASP